MLRNIGIPELILLIFLVILLFGARRIPEIAENLGKALRKFKEASQEEESAPQKDTPEHSKSDNTK
jgi:sec-independent protein translocase protein TatA